MKSSRPSARELCPVFSSAFKMRFFTLIAVGLTASRTSALTPGGQRITRLKARLAAQLAQSKAIASSGRFLEESAACDWKAQGCDFLCDKDCNIFGGNCDSGCDGGCDLACPPTHSPTYPPTRRPTTNYPTSYPTSFPTYASEHCSQYNEGCSTCTWNGVCLSCAKPSAHKIGACHAIY